MICAGVPSSTITGVNNRILNHGVLPKITHVKHRIRVPILGFSSSSSVLCRASEAAQLVQTASANIVVDEARVEDFWEVADIHCGVFFADYSFPMDLILRIDRLIGMLLGSSIPKGCNRTCLVAVSATCFGVTSSKIGRLIGILTVDTVADFLPRRRRQRRAGIAYISNVAVREECRRNGIAKKLILKAVAKATSWGCRAIALHCDANNEGAIELYRSQGFKCIRVPDGANWPKPMTSNDIRFKFMMKLI